MLEIEQTAKTSIAKKIGMLIVFLVIIALVIAVIILWNRLTPKEDTLSPSTPQTTQTERVQTNLPATTPVSTENSTTTSSTPSTPSTTPNPPTSSSTTTGIPNDFPPLDSVSDQQTTAQQSTTVFQEISSTPPIRR